MRSFLVVLGLAFFSLNALASDNLSFKYFALKHKFKKAAQSENLHPTHLETTLAQKLKEYHLIFVPGLLGQTVIKDSDQPIKLGFILGEYYKDNTDWLSSVGVSHERLILETEQSSEFNAAIIAEAIELAPKKVILITHSKGSIDALKALVDRKKLRSKVKSWLALQSPFYGARLASVVKKTPVLNDVADYLMVFLGGNMGAIDSVAKDTRKLSMSLLRNKLAIKDINSKIKVISYYSTKENTFGLDTILEPIRNLLSLIEGKNDGLVEASSTILPGSNYIGEGGVDHFLTVLDVWEMKSFKKKKLWTYDRLNNFKAWMYLSL